LLTRTWEGVC